MDKTLFKSVSKNKFKFLLLNRIDYESVKYWYSENISSASVTCLAQGTFLKIILCTSLFSLNLRRESKPLQRQQVEVIAVCFCETFMLLNLSDDSSSSQQNFKPLHQQNQTQTLHSPNKVKLCPSSQNRLTTGCAYFWFLWKSKFRNATTYITCSETLWSAK